MGRRIYRDGRVERWFKTKGWTIVKKADTHAINGKQYLTKRVVMGAFNKNFDINDVELHVLHINGNKKDNSFENLKVENLEEREARWAESNLRGEVSSIVNNIVWKLEQREKQEYYLKAVAAGGYAKLEAQKN